METYMGWGCPTCEIGNPAGRKRCKNCGRKRPEKLVLKIFNRAPRINKPKTRNSMMTKGFKKIYGGTRTGRLTSKNSGVQNIPRTLPMKPVETKLAARFSDGAMAELQTDGSVTCTCADFVSKNGCRHKEGITEFISRHPLKKKKEED
jgi:hypothetical protein